MPKPAFPVIGVVLDVSKTSPELHISDMRIKSLDWLLHQLLKAKICVLVRQRPWLENWVSHCVPVLSSLVEPKPDRSYEGLMRTGQT